MTTLSRIACPDAPLPDPTGCRQPPVSSRLATPAIERLDSKQHTFFLGWHAASEPMQFARFLIAFHVSADTAVIRAQFDCSTRSGRQQTAVPPIISPLELALFGVFAFW